MIDCISLYVNFLVTTLISLFARPDVNHQLAFYVELFIISACNVLPI